ncbi:MAG TPA: Rrf2 family transcriptional regulator [Clostridia bacterium]|nr:Rrf2 family transcriptional regulator [Clostridia bacterium]
MLLTTKGRYGLRAVYEIAASGNTPISLKTIANAQGISERYLEILMAVLKKHNIVNSARGASGGYTLARSPENITVGDVLRALEGPMAPAECVLPTRKSSDFDCIMSCSVHGVFKKLYKNINAALDSITIQDMLDEYKKD